MGRGNGCRAVVSLLHVLLCFPAFSQHPASDTNPFLASDQADLGWPHIRGPNYDAVSAEVRLADAWPDEGPPVLWAIDLGQGYSSWTVKDNRAYTQYQTLAGQFVICVDASTGETIWQYRYDWPFEASGLYPGPRSTPTIDNQQIYFSTPSGAVGCLNDRGKLIWWQGLKAKFNGQGTDFGYACSPTVVAGKVIMPVGGPHASMVAIEATSGEILWTSGEGSASYTPALPITVDGHRQVIGYLEHELTAFDLDTGKQLWRQILSRGYDEHSAWPVYQEPYLWTSAPFQAGSQLLRLSGNEDAAYEVVWQKSVMSNDVSSSVLVDEHLYGFDLAEAQSKAHRPSRGNFRAIHLLSGETAWANGNARVRRSTDYDENKATQTIGHASVITADGKLLLLNDLGDLILAKIDANAYVELARTPALQGEICWTSPALDRGRVFLRNHSRAVCIYVGEPAMLSTVARGDTLLVNELPQGAVFDVTSILGVEPEYAMDPPTRRWLRIWFVTSVVLLLVSGLVAALIKLSVRACSAQTIRWWFWGVAMGLGVVAGMPLSVALDEFVFTWPVTLFIVFQIAVYQSRLRRSEAAGERSNKWQDRIVVLAFLGTCGVYFWACRRLSLVTEWAFLYGFFGACPLLLAGRALSRLEKPFSLVWEFALTLIAFAAFFISTAILLSLRYELSEF